MSSWEATMVAAGFTCLTMILTAVAGWAWRLSANIVSLELRISKEYASVDHLKDVEDRLVSAVDGLRDSLDRTTAEIKSAVETMVAAFNKHLVDEARSDAHNRRSTDR